MKVVVCLKQILDPELPSSVFEISSNTKNAILDKHPLVTSPFDENALELALQLREKVPHCHIVALTYGSAQSEDTVRKALGLLVNEAVMVLQENDMDQDSYAVARVLAQAIRKLGSVDLVMCGRQAGDWDAGQVGFFLAEELGWPSINFVAKVEYDNGSLCLHSEIEGGWEIVETQLPAMVTVTNDEKNVLRVAKIKDVMMAHRKQVIKWSINDLGLKPEEIAKSMAYEELRGLFIPVIDNVCEIVEGEEPEEKVENLMEKLKNLKVF